MEREEKIKLLFEKYNVPMHGEQTWEDFIKLIIESDVISLEIVEQALQSAFAKSESLKKENDSLNLNTTDDQQEENI